MMPTIPQFFFFYHAVVIVVLSGLAVTRRNPVHSVLFMLVMFFHVAGLYLFLNAEFIAAVQIIVYAGAILVLFLFVVFLLNIRREEISDKYVSNWPTGIVIAGGMFTVIALSVRSFTMGREGEHTVKSISDMTHTKALGTVLYTKYLFPFEAASLILLVAIIGAITLTKKHLKQ